MTAAFSRRALLMGAVSLCAAPPAFAGAPQAAAFEDPFLGRTSQGDLVLAPDKTQMADLPAQGLRFFGVVRKTNVLTADGGSDKINMLELFAAFQGRNCRIRLCSLAALGRAPTGEARAAAEALRLVARRVKDHPDAVYGVADIDALKAHACTKGGTMTAWLPGRRLGG
jgi:hypothetical protein